jgi:branched-chain amino acid transport system ATP-binding protein
VTVAALAAHDLDAGYGAVAAVRGLNLEVAAGEIVALLGANGAGKTTTLMTLAGAIPALGGEVLLAGERARGPLHRRARAGVVLVPEERSVFMGLTVRDNLRVGRGAAQRVLEIFPELRDHLRRKAGMLSGGQQQMLTLGRALAAEPRVLLADELSLGLAPLLVARLLDAVRQAASDRGVAVLLVEQHIRSALEVADRVYVLRRGSVVLEGRAEELRARTDEIEQAYLHGPGGSV